ncbi:hypothetical protein LWI28_017599 [Acer negundo]|uniref:Uncharacterized protein n=1 Tax=Acer negundo TaxID=4023 RepID=A0AAD5J1L7_ACENE|nr:hypothetical protein LWI28_017599 [Acer negundo]
MDQTDVGITSASKLSTPHDARPQEIEDLAEAMIELAGEGEEFLLRPSCSFHGTPNNIPSCISCSLSSFFCFSYCQCRHFTWTYLAYSYSSSSSQLSPPATLSIPPAACSPLSEMVAKAVRVLSLHRRVQRQTSAISSVIPADSSPIVPPPPHLPPPPPPPPPPPSTRRQLLVDRVEHKGKFLLDHELG